MVASKIRRRLRDEYRHEGFYPSRYVERASWDDGACIIRLNRRSKKRFVVFAEGFTEVGMIGRTVVHEIFRVQRSEFFLNLKFVERAAMCARK